MPHGGGCLCGQVRYAVEGEPETISLCHCSSCRKAVGATPVAWAIFPVEGFEIVGESLVSHASSAGVTRTFCGRCGTSLTFRVEDSPDSVDITLASLDEPGRFTPGRHIWLEDGVIPPGGDIPGYQRDPI